MTAAAVSVRWKPAAMQAFFLPVDDRCVRAARSLRTGEIVDVGDSYKVNLQCITRDDADVAAQGDWKMAGFQAATAAGPSMA